MVNVSTKKQVHPVQVDGWWQAEQGFILHITQAGTLLPRIRALLFAWHAPSWYGSEVEEQVNSRSKTLELVIPPLLALDYLVDPQPNRLVEFAWSERLQVWTNVAHQLRHALLEGWFIPDLTKWNEQARVWKLAIPPHRLEAKIFNDTMMTLEDDGRQGISQWLSACVEALLAKDAKLAAAWEQTVAAVGPSVLAQQASDEDDWLVAIGLKADDVPFRLALQLHEPNSERSWHLRPAVQSRLAGGEWFSLEPARVAAHPLLRWALPATVPQEWQDHFASRMMKEEAKWFAALPDWADADTQLLRTELNDREAFTFLEQASATLLAAGAPVLLPAWWEAVRARKIRLKAKVRPQFGPQSVATSTFGLQQIVDFDWKLAVGNVDLTEEQFLQLVQHQGQLAQVNGEWVHLDPNDVERIRQWLRKQGKRKGLTVSDMMQMYLRGGGELASEDDEFPLTAEVELNAALTQWITSLSETNAITTVEKPEHFHGELRPYQQAGVSWLAFLRRYGLGSCLADDMGLGKTIQFTAYLMHVLESGSSTGPALLVCPTSVIGNWEKELEKFAPSLRVHLHYGTKRARGDQFAASIADADLIITSYTLVPLDEEEFGSLTWDIICLDEAQNIKNYYTKQSIAIRRLQAVHRVALTGTPMENRLTELWSIYDFMNPGYLGSLNEFRKTMIQPIERERNEELIAELQRWVKPFMLRRLKKDPAISLSLPPKQEMPMYLSLTVEQGSLYESIVSELLQKLDTLGAMQRRGLILATLTRLKQLCNHPSLLLSEEVGAVDDAWVPERSNKVLRLLEMVEEIAAEGERCLIFTQYIEMGKTLQRLISERTNLPTPYLHGGVPKADRDEMVSTFQNENQPGCAFVLSLKAGGTGLNLTAANHVIHFDRWWNPAVENQATDRVFRIGQKRNVQVHKYVTLGTLEERIDEMITRKQLLNEQVVGQSENWITELSTDDLRELFTLRKQRLQG